MQKLSYKGSERENFQDPWHRQKKNLDRVLEFANPCGVQAHAPGEDYSILLEEGSFDVVIKRCHRTPRLTSQEISNLRELLPKGGLFVAAMPSSVNLRERLAVNSGRSN